MIGDRHAKGLRRDVISCVRPRLMADGAADPPRRYRGEDYWARPLPGFGDPDAAIVLVGLAPAAHGGNRTGRIFTGDRSGDWLFAALHRAGLANQPTSMGPDDGLELKGAYVTAVNRCPPPENRPTTEERDNCLPYLVRELGPLHRARVLVTLGSYAWTGRCSPCAARRSFRGQGRGSGTGRRPRSRAGAGGTAPMVAVGLLSPEPAEHVHRQADGPDDG